MQQTDKSGIWPFSSCKLLSWHCSEHASSSLRIKGQLSFSGLLDYPGQRPLSKAGNIASSLTP